MNTNHFLISELLLKVFCCKLPTAVHWENLPRDYAEMVLIKTGTPDKEEQRSESSISLSWPPQFWGAFMFLAVLYLEMEGDRSLSEREARLPFSTRIFSFNDDYDICEEGWDVCPHQWLWGHSTTRRFWKAWFEPAQVNSVQYSWVTRSQNFLVDISLWNFSRQDIVHKCHSVTHCLLLNPIWCTSVTLHKETFQVAY